MKESVKSFKKRRFPKPLFIILIIFAVLAVSIILYVGNYYHADDEVGSFLASSENVAVSKWKHGLFLDGKGDDSAFIFYLGAKIEYTSYLPMLNRLAENGIDCFLVNMPCNIAFLGSGRASYAIREYKYEKWYIGGHSLGGAIAASYASSHPDDFNGLILLAAYPVSDLNNCNFSVLSVYGSEDRILNMANFDKNMSKLPESCTMLCIEGGNHAQFGNYGIQKGDGQANITHDNQQKQTINAILDFCEIDKD